MTRSTLTSPRRNGFSLVELLAVLAILSILVALGAWAVLPMLAGGARKNTTALLTKLDGTLSQQWAEAMKRAHNSPVPPGARSLANAPDVRDPVARAIWVKLQMKAHFPMSYAEALDPAGGNPYVQSYLQPRPVFVKALQRLTVPGTDARGLPIQVLGPVTTSPASQSSACLLIALQQVQSGMTFNPEDTLGPNAIKDTDGDGVPEIVDGWGNPVFFYRWGVANAELQALGAAKEPNPLHRDTEDRERALMNPQWHAALGGILVTEFERLCHPVRAGAAPQSYYTVPTVVSAGKDGVFGLDLRFMGPDGSGADGDNLYSFKMK